MYRNSNKQQNKNMTPEQAAEIIKTLSAMDDKINIIWIGITILVGLKLGDFLIWLTKKMTNPPNEKIELSARQQSGSAERKND